MPGVIRIAKSGARSAPTLPADAVTRTFGIFGMKDSGKTNTARVLVEGIAKVGGHVLILDPVGVWWGATRAGEGPGISGVVIGGEHADVPLEETGGKLIAQLAVSRHYPLIVVDMKMLRKGAQHRFLADCLEELYFGNRKPLHVVWEEADQSLPQNPRGMNPTLGRVLGAAEDIVKLGRSRGLGGTLISQRLATVNKNVTEQIESLLLLRLVGPNDLKAVKEWVQSNGDPEETAKVLSTIASLYQGEAWMYSPGWLRLLEKIKVRHARTLDSSATPTIEESAVEEDAKRAPVSLDGLRAEMQATIERAKESDPSELKKRVAHLERELQELRAAPTPVGVPEMFLPWSADEEKKALDNAEAAVRITAKARELAAEAMREMDDAVTAGVELVDLLKIWSMRKGKEEMSTLDLLVAKAGRVPDAAPARAPAAKASREPGAVAESVSAPQQRILDALAWFQSIGRDKPRRPALGAVAGVSSRSSGFERNLSVLRSGGFIDYPHSGCVMLTGDGETIANFPDSPATAAELQEAIYRMVSGPQGSILRALVGVFPGSLDRESLADAVGVSASSSGFERNLSVLRTFELADYPSRGQVIATDVLFI